MNNRENKPRLIKARFRLLTLLAVVLFSIVALVLVQARHFSTERDYNSPRGETPLVSQQRSERTGHSDYLLSLTRRAMQQGFGKESVMLLAPERGPGREVVASRLRTLLTQSGGRFGHRLMATDLKETQSDRRILSYVGEDSYLEVYTDGTKFRFRGNLDDPKEIERIGTQGKLGQSELESLGRRFITEALGSLVKVGAGESITFLGTRHLMHGGSDENGVGHDKVIANIAIFGRELNGIPVVGSGSKIAVWFAADREPVGFDVDWPAYKVTQAAQDILPRDRLRERVDAFITVPSDSSMSRVTRFECGYVDLGVTKRGGQIQAGCAVFYVDRDRPANSAAETLTWARVEFIPAGVQVLKDDQWPLTNLIATGREPEGRNNESISLSTESDPGTDPSRLDSQSANDGVQTPQTYPLVCRGSSNPTIWFKPERRLVLKFKKGTAPAGSGLSPGECSWLDRGMREGEPDILVQQVRESGDDDPEYKWTSDLNNPNNYWTFDVYNGRDGQLIVTRSLPRK
jgi:hypothetical protein